MPPIAQIGSIVTVTPSEDVEIVSGPKNCEFIKDLSPFTMVVSGLVKEDGALIGVFGKVISGHDRYKRLIATIFVRITGSDWTQDNCSAANVFVGRSPARSNGKFPFSKRGSINPEGIDIDGFPFMLRFGMVDARMGDEKGVDSASEA